MLQSEGGVDLKEPPVTRSIVLGLAVLALSTSAALAAHRYHHHAMNAYSPMGPPPAGPAVWMGGANDNYTMYRKNLHDSGYNPKNDYANGLLRVQ